jgi:hypothetical protein
MLLRGVTLLLAGLALLAGCKKDKPEQPTGQPQPTEKTVTPEVATALERAASTCKKTYDATDPDKIKAEVAFDEAATEKGREDCTQSLDLVLTKDASLASYKGEIQDRPYDIPALKKMASDLPGRIEVAKATFEDAVKAKKEAERAEWMPLLKGDRVKVFEENGKPTSTDASDTTTAAAAAATTWIYQSPPRQDGDKQVVDVKTYKFKKDKLSGKPVTKTEPYVAPE